MAQVDFSNAVLDVRTDVSVTYPMTISYLAFNTSNYLFSASDSAEYVSGNVGKSVILNTPSKVSFLFTGTFTTSGTEFYIGNLYGGSAARPWKVSNISFSNGDTYAFVIDIEVSGNT